MSHPGGTDLFSQIQNQFRYFFRAHLQCDQQVVSRQVKEREEQRQRVIRQRAAEGVCVATKRSDYCVCTNDASAVSTESHCGDMVVAELMSSPRLPLTGREAALYLALMRVARKLSFPPSLSIPALIRRTSRHIHKCTHAHTPRMIDRPRPCSPGRMRRYGRSQCPLVEGDLPIVVSCLVGGLAS
eukprot:GHVU01010571.1.p2 GENE.GHVU01010571.1~~GHVU01010571.1.p2  ORF type:complete len:185 (-),score=8.38 GHVU01010571.1:37-591(-)